jgi:hypothetical protein
MCAFHTVLLFFYAAIEQAQIHSPSEVQEPHRFPHITPSTSSNHPHSQQLNFVFSHASIADIRTLNPGRKFFISPYPPSPKSQPGITLDRNSLLSTPSVWIKISYPINYLAFRSQLYDEKRSGRILIVSLLRFLIFFSESPTHFITK